ncbi:MAG: hypothetical protein GXP40_12765 [Chloroflexi bacterium]|nr:hypothetical protein [Chloroflexota bacterium]
MGKIAGASKEFRRWLRANQRVVAALLLVMVVAGAYYFYWALSQTYVPNTHIGLERIEKNMWWANDSREYRGAGDWIFGNSSENWIGRRPWVYPLIVGFLRAVFPEQGEIYLWVLQLLAWLFTSWFIGLAIYRSTGKIWLMLLGTGIFWSHPSPIALTFHGLTETLTTLMLAVLCWLLVGEAKHKDYWVLLLMGLLVVTRPTYQIQLVLLLGYFLIKNRKRWRLRQWGMVVLVLVPLWLQLTLSYRMTGRVMISEVSETTLRDFFVAWTYAHANGIDGREAAQVVSQWDSRQQIDYLMNNKRMAVVTYLDNLVPRGLLADSYFVMGESNPMNEVIASLNAGYLYLHLLMLPLMLYFLLFYQGRHREALWIMYATFLIQIFSSGISSNQGDRLIITALPLWIVSYAYVINDVITSPGKLLAVQDKAHQD